MHRFQQILYYVAPGEGLNHALTRAFGLARSNGAELTLMSVHEPIPSLVKRFVRSALDVDELVLETQRGLLDSLARSSQAEGIPLRTVMRTGKPYVELIREVQAEGHDLLMKAGAGTSGSLLGSTALHLLRKCPCPVWVIDPEHASFRRIVAAVDVSEEADWQLHRKVIELGHSLSRTSGASLEVVHAWGLMAEHLLRSRLSTEELHAWLEDTRSAAETRLEELARQAGVADDVKRVLIKGFHGDVLSKYLSQGDVDMVVMGTISRTGVAGMLVGNTAERVLKDMQCSVLAVKPEKFVTPIDPGSRGGAGARLVSETRGG